MKFLLLFISVSLFICSCATSNNFNTNTTTNFSVSDTLRIANDSLEYEVVIFEPGFNTWLITQRPRGYYSEIFLEIRNRRYVAEYNRRVQTPWQFDPNLYPQTIDYQMQIHYGYEVNYLLYNYFLFFEQRYKQRFIGTRG